MQIYRFICSYYVIILSVQYQWHRKWLVDAFSFRKACGDPQGGNGRDSQSQWAFWPSSWSSTQSCHLSQPLSANPDLLFLFSVHLVFLRVQAFVPSCCFLLTEILQTSLICSPSCLVVYTSWHPPSSSLSHALLSTVGLKDYYYILLSCISSALDSITSPELDVVHKPLKQIFFQLLGHLHLVLSPSNIQHMKCCCFQSHFPTSLRCLLLICCICYPFIKIYGFNMDRSTWGCMCTDRTEITMQCTTLLHYWLMVF